MGAMRNMTEEQRKAAKEARKQMVKALLADRFKLTASQRIERSAHLCASRCQKRTENQRTAARGKTSAG